MCFLLTVRGTSNSNEALQKLSYERVMLTSRKAGLQRCEAENRTKDRTIGTMCVTNLLSYEYPIYTVGRENVHDCGDSIYSVYSTGRWELVEGYEK